MKRVRDVGGASPILLAAATTLNALFYTLCPVNTFCFLPDLADAVRKKAGGQYSLGKPSERRTRSRKASEKGGHTSKDNRR